MKVFREPQKFHPKGQSETRDPPSLEMALPGFPFWGYKSMDLIYWHTFTRWTELIYDYWHVSCLYEGLTPFSETPDHYWESASTTPSSPLRWWRHIQENFWDPRSLWEIREYTPSPLIGLRIWRKYEMIWKNKSEYVKNMKKYTAMGITRAKHRAKGDASRHTYLSPYIKALELGIIPSSPYIGFGPQHSLWDLEKLRASFPVPV